MYNQSIQTLESDHKLLFWRLSIWGQIQLPTKPARKKEGNFKNAVEKNFNIVS